MLRRRAMGPLAGLFLVLGLSAPVFADEIARSVVVSMEDFEAFFIAPPDVELRQGQEVRFKHPIRMENPNTGKWVEDELPLGEASISMVGKSLAMVRLEQDLRAELKIGDVVEIRVPTKSKLTAPRETKELPPLPRNDEVTQRALEVWKQSAGRSLETRIALWEEFLEDENSATFASDVEREIEILRKMRERDPEDIQLFSPEIDGVLHEGPRHVPASDPLTLSFALDRPQELLAAWLHYRPAGERTYKRLTMRKDGDTYLRATLSPDELRGNSLEYFVEVVEKNGEEGIGVGSVESPERISLDREDRGALRDTRNRSRVSVLATYLDYATFDPRAKNGEYRDRYALFETDFLFRLRREWLYGIRVGMGVLQGEGGFEDQAMGESAGFQYGYTEFEFRTKPTRAYLARLVTGLGKDGLAFGAEGRLRLGEEQKSNISFALSSMEDVGFLTEVRMQWAAINRLPLGFAVGVTDQPNNGDLGVRLTGDIGLRAWKWMQPTIRVSYQGRSIRHSGMGVGLGCVFDW